MGGDTHKARAFTAAAAAAARLVIQAARTGDKWFLCEQIHFDTAQRAE